MTAHPDDVRAMPEPGVARLRVDGLRSAAIRLSNPLGLTLVLALVAWWWYTLAIQGAPGWAFDFRQFWQGARDVVNGVSPYPERATLDRVGAGLDLSHWQTLLRFPYPAPAAVVLVPFALVGFHTAAAIWGALLIASYFATLWVLGVRDWRVLAVVVTSQPVVSSVRGGTFTPILVLLVALAWRWRDRPWISGGSIALAISFKIFLWPMVVWLAATRRFAAAAVAVVLAVALTLGAWAAIGFRGFTEYPELARKLADIFGPGGLSLVALGGHLGLSGAAAGALSWAVGLSLLACVVMLARRGEDERMTFSVALVAALALTPIVWLHYFALLVVPLALVWPRLSWAWLLMWPMWLLQPGDYREGVWKVLLPIALTAALLAQVARVTGRKVVT